MKQDSGLIQIYFGSGKGKTSAAIGTILRCLNYNYKVGIIKFFKQKKTSGEDNILKKFSQIEIYYSMYPAPIFYNKKNRNKYLKNIIDEQKRLFLIAEKLVQKNYKLIVLDEVLDLIKLKIIATENLLKLFKIKNNFTELILTGHYINHSIIEKADLVSEIKKIKHYYDNKISARKGFEF